MNYVCYYRVSTRHQEGSGLGLEAQEAIVKHFTDKGEVIATFTEIQSGKDIANRPQLQQAIDTAKQHQAILIVAKVDRLSRNTKDTLEILEDLQGNGAKLQCCDLPGEVDKFTLTLFAAIAERERELIGIRTKAALAAKKRQGHQLGNPENLTGYRKGVKAIKANARNNSNNRRATALITNLRNSGKTFREIAAELNESGFKTRNGCEFKPAQVHRLYQRAEACQAV